MSAQPSGSMLNLGCGALWHPDWVNLDRVADGEHVQYADLHRGIPYDDESFSVVYHAHLLEHFSRDRGRQLMQECWRVLVPGGRIRVVVPDLEYLARRYIDTLDNAKHGTNADREIHEWTVIALYDQAVRTKHWGRAKSFLLRVNDTNVREYIVANYGEVAAAVFQDADRRRESGKMHHASPKQTMSWTQTAARLVRGLEYYRILQEVRFRAEGEVHQWMYDEVSLSNLLARVGFRDIVVRTAHESSIPGWPSYHLDTDSQGTARKPESLYMEAVR